MSNIVYQIHIVNEVTDQHFPFHTWEQPFVAPRVGESIEVVTPGGNQALCGTVTGVHWAFISDSRGHTYFTAEVFVKPFDAAPEKKEKL